MQPFMNKLSPVTTCFIFNYNFKLNKSTACGCQCSAVGCLIEDKRLKKGHNSEKKKKKKSSRHSLSGILQGKEKKSRQLVFELNICLSKPEVITGSRGMVKTHFKNMEKAGWLS